MAVGITNSPRCDTPVWLASSFRTPACSSACIAASVSEPQPAAATHVSAAPKASAANGAASAGERRPAGGWMERAMAANAWPVSSQHSLTLREVSCGKQWSAVLMSSSVAARPLRSRLSRAHCVERGGSGEGGKLLVVGMEKKWSAWSTENSQDTRAVRSHCPAEAKVVGVLWLL